MNTVQSTTRTPGFIAAAVVADITPRMLGVLDAETGRICVPEEYFAFDGDIAEYTEGFRSVAGDTLTTRQIRRILTDAEMVAEAEDYEGDMMDRLQWARGAW